MADEVGTAWEQPLFEEGLEVIAVDLITGLVQQVFAGLDPPALVEAADRRLSDADKQAVADLIDAAVVELEIAFRADRVELSQPGCSTSALRSS